jgi:hypothetical protein
MKFLACVTAAILLLFACADNGAPPHDESAVETVSVGEMVNGANGAAVVDLRREGVVYQVDHGVKLDGVTLICPNQQVVPFASWVSLQGREFGIDYDHLVGGFSVLKGKSRSGDKAKSAGVDNLVECPPGCRPCTDGSCICGGEVE